jgi:hypothetical protein
MKPTAYSGLSPKGRRAVREAYVKEQGGRCFYCDLQLTGEPADKPPIDWSWFPDNFLKYPIHLQHDHETDMTEGAVHAYCNAVMWQYEGR